MTSTTLTIDTIKLPAGRLGMDAGDLAARIEQELARLLTRYPVPDARRPAGPITIDHCCIPASSTATPASVAAAVAQHVHLTLLRGGVSR